MQMKTERLYYDNPGLLEFQASIVETFNLGERIGVILDRTAFYPTSGGQPHDEGTLEGIPVVDCYEDERSDSIVHVLTARPDSAQVYGRIDGARRADHRQQHSGQHVLSQAFSELFNWPTFSFHLGAVTCTIDLPADSIKREQGAQAEELANRIVQENRTVSIRYATPDNIADLGLRKATERSGDIRIIDINGFDRSACGGTHVHTTQEIGPILITGISRAKRQSRVEFICGNRVLRYARDANRALESISQTVSAAPFDTPAAVAALWSDAQHKRKRIEELESKLLHYEAAEFPVRDGLAVGVFRNRGVDSLKALAAKISARPSTLVLLADQSDELRVVFARSSDLNVDVAELIRKTIEQFGGRGGGRPNLAQAGGLNSANPETVLEFAEKHLKGKST
jgi:alanyl-tRNA synthetase